MVLHHIWSLLIITRGQLMASEIVKADYKADYGDNLDQKAYDEFVEKVNNRLMNPFNIGFRSLFS